MLSFLKLQISDNRIDATADEEVDTYADHKEDELLFTDHYRHTRYALHPKAARSTVLIKTYVLYMTSYLLFESRK